jgi:2-desacetyl-2-hydroxyethyl bacteriochlorophyllide A dehydrogenase
MWTSTLDLDPKRVLITQLLRRIWPNVSFSSLAPLQVQNLPRQSLPERNWVRVRNRLAGICGSDLHLIQGDGDFRIAPAALALHTLSYPGHEVVGEVLEVGEDVQRIRVGDRVALQYGPNCLSSGVQSPCRSCVQGYYNLCEYGKLPGPSALGGGWSEEMLLPEQQLFRVPTTLSDEQAVLLEPTAVAVHAVLRHLPQQNERVLIIGAGAIGLLTLQVVRALAPQAEVSVLARHSFQIEQATRMGAAHIIYPQDSYAGVQRATNARIYKGIAGNQTLLGGYDVIFDTIGNQKTLHNALRWARTQATVVLVGVHLHPMHIDLTPVWFQEVNLIGSIGSSVENWPPTTHERRSTFEIVLELMEHDQIHPELLITHRFPLNNYQTALITAAGKTQTHAIKVVFDYSLLPPSVVPNVRASAARKRRPPIPIDENTSAPEKAATPQSISSPALPVEAVTPAIPLSPLFSSSQTVAPYYEDDEFDETEDTITAPAITKYKLLIPAAPQVQEHAKDDERVSKAETDTSPTALTRHTDEPVIIDEGASVTPPEPDSLAEETTLSKQENAIQTEPATETAIIEQQVQEEQVAEKAAETDSTPPVAIEEPAQAIANALHHLTYETPETFIDAEPDSAEAFELPSVFTEDATEFSDTQTTFEEPPTREFDAQSVDIDQYNFEHSEHYILSADAQAVDVDQYDFEHSEHYTRENLPDPSEEYAEFLMQPEASEFFPEPAPQIAEEALSTPDLAIKDEIDAGDATDGTENALLPIEGLEGSPIAKAQNRPRPRTRKKNNRASVEKRS